MKRLLVIGAIFLCVSCAKQKVIPPADISFVSIGNESGGGLYDIRFTSPADLMGFFKRQTGEAQNGESLVCSLDGGTDFLAWNKLSNYARGELTEVDSLESVPLRTFSANVFVRHTKDGSLNTSIPTPELLALLSERKSVPCKVLISGDSYGPYYSSVMQVPAADFLKAVERKRW